MPTWGKVQALAAPDGTCVSVSKVINDGHYDYYLHQESGVTEAPTKEKDWRHSPRTLTGGGHLDSGQPHGNAAISVMRKQGKALSLREKESNCLLNPDSSVVG